MKSLLTKTLVNGSFSDVLRTMTRFLAENHFYETSQGLGFNGKLLQESIRHEWILNNLYQCEEPAFLIEKFSENTFREILKLVEKLPFSLITFHPPKQVTVNKEDQTDADFLFLPNSSTIIEKKIFGYPSTSLAVFHRQQRERRIWWRKFSSLPGRFSTTEITPSGGNTSFGITAAFPWRSQAVETLNLDTEQKGMQVKEGRKCVNPHIIKIECDLEIATSVYMCDAYDPINEENSREMMRFHRKLSPYKVTFAYSAANGDAAKELADLTLVLARRIRKLGIPCLLLPEVGKKSLDFVFRRADAMGIPYVIVLNDRTLQDGILQLRNRDTTLQEQSHVSMVVPYVEKIMKSY